jgi:hypothetical protein
MPDTRLKLRFGFDREGRLTEVIVYTMDCPVTYPR